jgi:hypothetical protein
MSDKAEDVRAVYTTRVVPMRTGYSVEVYERGSLVALSWTGGARRHAEQAGRELIADLARRGVELTEVSHGCR